MTAKLYYANGRGLGEVVRIALGTAEIPFEESFIESKEDLTKLRSEGRLLFDQAPMLEIDGLNLVQSMAIVRYICSKKGWTGKTPEENARINMLSDGARDMYMTIYFAWWQKVMNHKEQEWKKAMEKVNERYLPIFDKELESNGTGYLVGDGMSLADFAFLDAVTFVSEVEMEMFIPYPNILNFLATMTSHPGLQKFLDGPQRKPLPTLDYIKTACATFDIVL